jgi:hypothetical protein
MSLRQFWREFGNDWTVLMGGAGSIFSWAVSAILPSWFSPMLFWPIGSACALLVALRIWHKSKITLDATPRNEPVPMQEAINALPPQLSRQTSPDVGDKHDLYNSTDDVAESDLRPWTKMACPRCMGTALDWGRVESPCPKCDAHGFVSGEYLKYPKCLVCKATGWHFGRIESECPVCQGFGRRVPKG